MKPNAYALSWVRFLADRDEPANVLDWMIAMTLGLDVYRYRHPADVQVGLTPEDFAILDRRVQRLAAGPGGIARKYVATLNQ